MPGKGRGILLLPVLSRIKPVLFIGYRKCRFSVKHGKEILRVGPYGHVHMEGVLLKLSGINVHHYDLCGPGPGLPVISHLPDGDPRSHRQDEIRILDRKVSRPVPHVSGPAAVQRIIVLYKIHGVPVGYDGYVKLFGHRPEGLISPRKPYAVACVKNRPLRFFNKLKDLIGRILRNGRRKQLIILLRVIAVKLTGVYCHALEIYGNVYPYRARTPRTRKVPALFQSIPYILRILYHHRILGHCRNGLRYIVFLITESPYLCPGMLKGIPCGGVIAYLSAYHKHRYRIKPPADYSGNGVGPSGACGNAHRRYPVIEPCIGLRGHCAGLLMMVIGDLQPFLMPQSVI